MVEVKRKDFDQMKGRVSGLHGWLTKGGMAINEDLPISRKLINLTPRTHLQTYTISCAGDLVNYVHAQRRKE